MPEIDHLIFVHNEKDITNFIQNIRARESILMIVIPSMDTQYFGNDDLNDVTTGFLFMVQKQDDKKRDMVTELQLMGDMQNFISAIKYLLHKEATDCDAEMHDYFEGMNFGTMHCDPEKNFCGCDGWSLSFTITDPFWTLTEEELAELFPLINN